MGHTLENSVIGQRLLEETQQSSVESAIRSLIDRFGLRPSVSCAPIDLAKVCNALSLSDIQYKDIPCDGMLEPIGESEYRVTISNMANWRRQRFSLAHECGHVLLHRLLPETRSYAERNVFLQPDGPSEEAVCDRIAAELLMPTELFLESAGTRPITISLLKELASKFNVSLASAARRLGELANADDFAVCRFLRMPGKDTATVVNVHNNFRNDPLTKKCALRLNSTKYDESHVKGKLAIEDGWYWIRDQDRKRRSIVNRRLYAQVHRTNQSPYFLVILCRHEDFLSQPASTLTSITASQF